MTEKASNRVWWFLKKETLVTSVGNLLPASTQELIRSAPASSAEKSRQSVQSRVTRMTGPGEHVSGVSGAGARATRLLNASDNNCVEVGAGVESIFNLRVVNSCVLLALGQVRGPGGQAVREKSTENREKRKVSNWWLNPVTQEASNRNWLFQEKGVVINGS